MTFCLYRQILVHMDTPTISIDLEKYRKDAGLSEEQLSDLTGIARSTLRRKLRDPARLTVAEFITVTKILKVPDSALLVA